MAFCSIVIYAGSWLANSDAYYTTLFAVICIAMVAIVVVIARQPISSKVLSFKVPWVPVIPCLSVVINLYLMLELDAHTWIRFSVWMAIGELLPFFYDSIIYQ